jgi:leucyl/phenylalanyl-tRNA--protein transferase
VTEHLRSFGAIEVPRERYRILLDAALDDVADFEALPGGTTGAEVLEVIAERARS